MAGSALRRLMAEYKRKVVCWLKNGFLLAFFRIDIESSGRHNCRTSE